jgi:hypothetical protein
MSILCFLGFHKWISILPGQMQVKYEGKMWWTIGGIFQDYCCERCGKVRGGTVLIDEHTWRVVE